MTINFTCPHCGAKTVVADEYIGHSGPCAECGQTVTVQPSSGTSDIVGPKRSSMGPLIVAVVGVLVVCLVCGGGIFALYFKGVSTGRGAARRAQCTNNLKQIAIALNNYAAVHGSFPPAYVADDNCDDVFPRLERFADVEAVRLGIIPGLADLFVVEVYCALVVDGPEVQRMTDALELLGRQFEAAAIGLCPSKSLKLSAWACQDCR